MTKTSTYSGQSKLPRLPIPSLEETLKRFPQKIWALQDSEQRNETQRIVSNFLNGNGPRLQALLEAYDNEGIESGYHNSYVEEFWSDAYLTPDQSVVLNLNPFFLLEDGPDPKTSKDQIGRASSLVFACAKSASLLKKEELTPDFFRGNPLCMDQFKAFFGACRIPSASGKDCVDVDPSSNHIIVMKRNQIYYFQALWPDGSVAVDENDIQRILLAIDKDSIESNMDPIQSSQNAVGVLTTLTRKTWAAAREELLESSERNRKSMQIIDSALFVLVLDDFAPKNIHEAASNILHGTYDLCEKDSVDYQAGTCTNRWYDKLQIIVCADGSAGINFEHSAIDGHTALRVVSDIFADTIVSFAQSITKTIYGVGRIPSVLDTNVNRAADAPLHEDGTIPLDTHPKKLHFSLSASTRNQIYFAETALGDEIFASDTYVLEFKDFGKVMIISNKMSPDSFVQMSMILAYYRLYGKVVCSYEPVLTKRFLHGRTEAMRSTTPEAAAFCEVFCDPNSSNTEKLDALKLATIEHSSLVKEAAGGKGVDRHLFALKCVAEKHGLPQDEFFKSEPWALLNHTVISTSNCGNPSLRLFGFGPVVPDGFGIGYIIRDFGLQYSISSKHRQTKRFAHILQRTLNDIGNLLSNDNKIKVSRQKSTVSDNFTQVDSAMIHEDSQSINVEEKKIDPGRIRHVSSFFASVRRREKLEMDILLHGGSDVLDKGHL